MIYLIGAPPRCGKTTLAKNMSKKTKIPWISCDTLDSIAQTLTTKDEWAKKFPYTCLRRTKGNSRNNDVFYNTYSPAKIVSVLNKQAKAVHTVIDVVIACEIADGNDYIIEGYHIVPDFVQKMIKKHGKQNIKVVFLTKFDADKFAKDVYKSTTPNDWLLVLTKKQETFVKVGKMVSEYSTYFESEAKKFGFITVNTDENFNKQIDKATKYLLVQNGKVAE
jgi:2-phosphoglycerate kinase